MLILVETTDPKVIKQIHNEITGRLTVTDLTGEFDAEAARFMGSTDYRYVDPVEAIKMAAKAVVEVTYVGTVPTDDGMIENALYCDLNNVVEVLDRNIGDEFVGYDRG